MHNMNSVRVNSHLQIDWSPVDQVLEAAIANGSFPGCVALVGNQQVRN